MRSTHTRPTARSVLAVLALLVIGLAFAVATNPAGAADRVNSPVPTKHHAEQRLVVRGDATVTDAPCDAGICIELDGQFRGTPVGTGAYTGSIKLKVAEGFPNGEGGVCAPISGRIVLGAGSADRLVLGLRGDSCQDGEGDLTQAAFTNVAEFVVKYGTGEYAKARGNGLATFSEDASDRERMTLIGSIYR